MMPTTPTAVSSSRIPLQLSLIHIYREQVIAVGNYAYEMHERTPSNIEVITPMSNGRIANVLMGTLEYIIFSGHVAAPEPSTWWGRVLLLAQSSRPRLGRAMVWSHAQLLYHATKDSRVGTAPSYGSKGYPCFRVLTAPKAGRSAFGLGRCSLLLRTVRSVNVVFTVFLSEAHPSVADGPPQGPKRSAARARTVRA